MAIYAVLFVSSDPVAKDKLQTSMKVTSDELEIALQDLTNVLKESSPLTLQKIENSVQLVTRPEFSANIRETLNNIPKKIKLSQESLETLTIIAYKQPITKAEIDEAVDFIGATLSGIYTGLMGTFENQGHPEYIMYALAVHDFGHLIIVHTRL